MRVKLQDQDLYLILIFSYDQNHHDQDFPPTTITSVTMFDTDSTMKCCNNIIDTKNKMRAHRQLITLGLMY